MTLPSGRDWLFSVNADCDVAKLDLVRSEVKTSVQGTITNMDLQAGSSITAVRT